MHVFVIEWGLLIFEFIQEHENESIFSVHFDDPFFTFSSPHQNQMNPRVMAEWNTWHDCFWVYLFWVGASFFLVRSFIIKKSAYNLKRFRMVNEHELVRMRFFSRKTALGIIMTGKNKHLFITSVNIRIRVIIKLGPLDDDMMDSVKQA